MAKLGTSALIKITIVDNEDEVLSSIKPSSDGLKYCHPESASDSEPSSAKHKLMDSMATLIRYILGTYLHYQSAIDSLYDKDDGYYNAFCNLCKKDMDDT